MIKNNETEPRDPYAVELLSRCVQAGMAFLIVLSAYLNLERQKQQEVTEPLRTQQTSNK